MSIPTVTEIENYLHSTAWRNTRRRWFLLHPYAACSRCGITNIDHKKRFGRRLTLEHTSYRHLGKEQDDELVPVCARCLASEFADLPDDDWTGEALRRIRKRKKILGRLYDSEQEKLWDALERLAALERYVWWAREKHAEERIPFSRLLRCSRRTTAAYLLVRKTRDESGKVPTSSFTEEVADELEENGLAVRDDESIRILDEQSRNEVTA